MMYAQQVRFLSKLALLAATLIIGIASLAQAQQRFNTPDVAVEALVAAARYTRFAALKALGNSRKLRS